MRLRNHSILFCLAVRAGFRLLRGKKLTSMADFPAHVAQHLVLALSSLSLALAAGLPMGLLAAESAPLRGWVLASAGIGRTIPSLAVLMLLLPWLGVGATPAIVALALLAIPPIVISVDLGIRGVPPAALDAAAGMGMTPLQRFGRVVVPFALPVSFTGLRTAATETIASATLATFIGAGGLGDEIVRGLQTDDAPLLFAAAAMVAALALAADVALAAAARAAARA
jgi:osmoprotectant transport system permease protein